MGNSMSKIKLKNFTFVLTINILVLVLILGVLEISSRITFPEFRGHIHSELLTMGKKKYYTDFYGYKVRVKTNGSKIAINQDKELILIFGDSVSDGFGHSIHEIWWKKLEEALEIKRLKYQFVSISGFGNNFVDSIENGRSLINQLELTNKKPKKVIYQFNFNDILKLRNNDLKADVDNESSWIKFSKWRYENLNKSVFFRVAQHYAGSLTRKKSGDCEERAYDALGSYSWTFGSTFISAESELQWQIFEKNLIDFKKNLEEKGIKFEILIAPILYQIDEDGVHPHYNYQNLDFNCASIQPRERLNIFTLTNDIVLYDPINYLRDKFDDRVKEGNFVPFYFTADDNHFTPIASNYIAHFVAKNWKDKGK